MGFFEDLLGKKKETEWTATHRGLIKDVTYDEIVRSLGRPQKAKGGYIFWRGSLADVDPDYPEDAFYQLSNKSYGGWDGYKGPSIDREIWYIHATSPQAIGLIADEISGISRDIESV